MKKKSPDEDPNLPQKLLLISRSLTEGGLFSMTSTKILACFAPKLRQKNFNFLKQNMKI